MINEDALVAALAPASRGRVEKLICVLASLPQPARVEQVRDRAVAAGLPAAAKWNISQALARVGNLARRLPLGWQLTEEGWEKVKTLGVSVQSPIVGGTARSLKDQLSQIADARRRDFLSDALLCFDKGAHRPAVVYSWVGAMWILQNAILNGDIASFNKAGASRFNKDGGDYFRKIASIESFGRLKEADMLLLMEDASVIGKSLHKQLRARLDLRNDCGHPNTIVVDEHTCAAHVHFLIENVYKRF